MQEKVRR